MKKSVYILVLFLSIVSLTLVSAQYYGGGFYGGTVDFFDSIFREMEPIIRFVLGGDGIYSGEIIFIKFLVFLLILAITLTAVKRVPTLGDDEKIAKVISIIIALLAARFLTTEALVNLIWLPYGVLGVVLSSMLPLIIFLFFIESLGSDFLRKVGWTAFAFIYFGLALYRWQDFAIGYNWYENLAMIYLGVAIVSVLMLIFDKKVRAKLLIASIKRDDAPHRIMLKSELQREIRDIDNALANPSLSSKERSKLNKEKSNLQKAIAAID